MSAVFDSNYVKRINGPNLKPKGSKMDHAEMLMDDIRNFKQRTNSARLAMIWCGLTESSSAGCRAQHPEGFRMRPAE